LGHLASQHETESEQHRGPRRGGVVAGVTGGAVRGLPRVDASVVFAGQVRGDREMLVVVRLERRLGGRRLECHASVAPGIPREGCTR